MIHISGKVYEIIYENKNGWNADAFRDRYSEVLDRYDYIVGDWGYNQLRLKGFLRDTHNKATKDCAYSSLSDYINEYCNFGCAYFVLEKVGTSRRPEDETEVEDLDEKPAKEHAAVSRYAVREDGGEEPGKPVKADRAERTDRQERVERADRTERAERVDRPEYAERTEQADRAGRPGRVDRTERAEKQERADRADRTERQERADRPERLDHADRADRPGRAEHANRPERPERADKQERFERLDRPDKPNRHPGRERGQRHQDGQADGEGGATVSSQRKSYRPNHRNKKPFRPAKDDVAAASEDNRKPPRKDNGRS